MKTYIQHLNYLTFKSFLDLREEKEERERAPAIAPPDQLLTVIITIGRIEPKTSRATKKSRTEKERTRD